MVISGMYWWNFSGKVLENREKTVYPEKTSSQSETQGRYSVENIPHTQSYYWEEKKEPPLYKDKGGFFMGKKRGISDGLGRARCHEHSHR